MPKNPHDLLADIANQHTVVQHSLDRLAGMIAAYRDLVPDPRADGVRGPKVKSLMEWVTWLSENGPAYRQVVCDGTGINLSSSGSQHVRKWKEHMEMWSNDLVPGDTLLTISAPREKEKRGRPPVIYFLWSQRYDVLPLFGVGPTRDSQSNEPEPQAMTGVIQPPTLGEQTLAVMDDIGEVGFDMDKAREQTTLTPIEVDGTIHFPDTTIFDGCCDWTGGDDVNRHAAYHRMKGIHWTPAKPPTT